MIFLNVVCAKLVLNAVFSTSCVSTVSFHTTMPGHHWKGDFEKTTLKKQLRAHHFEELEYLRSWKLQCLNASMFECLNARRVGSFNAWMFDCLNVWMIWQPGSFNFWMFERSNVWKFGYSKSRKLVRLNMRNDWMSGELHVSMFECLDFENLSAQC